MGNSLTCARLLERGGEPAASRRRSSRNGSCANKSVAKVLLVDGSVLRFKAPVKAIQVLMDHPQHFICPLDSLKPGIHSLPVLLPHEEVSLGKLYLLLPSSKSLQMQRYGSGSTRRSSPQLAMVKHAKKPAVGSCSLPLQTDMDSSHLEKTGMGSSHLKKTDMGSSRLEKTDMGSSHLKKRSKGSSDLEKTEMGSSGVSQEMEMAMAMAMAMAVSSLMSKEGTSHGAQRSEEGGKKRRPPYPSRCRRTWVPRLQTIEESIHPPSPPSSSSSSIACIR